MHRARVLLPREQILLSGAIMSRSTIFNKRRFLILTDYPRLLVCRVHKASVRVKHEILFGTDTPLSAAWPTTFAANAGEFYRTRAKQKEDDGPALQTFVTVVEDGPRFFRLATVLLFTFLRLLFELIVVLQNLRGFKFEDASGTAPASRWVAAIRQTQQSSYVREPSTAP